MKRKLAKSSKEFDRRFDAGEDIHNLIEMSQAKVVHHGKRSASLWISQNHWLKKLTKSGKPSVLSGEP